MQGPTLFSAPLALNEPVTCDTDVRQTQHTAAKASVCAWSRLCSRPRLLALQLQQNLAAPRLREPR